MTASHAADQLASPVLLRKIDELREKNISQHIPLPQLVVVGDQSSGKSSLLETLTGIPFERNVELCTRYATQITSRRDPESRVTVTIIPGPDASEDHKNRLSSYSFESLTNEDFRDRLPKILAQVNTAMGIRTGTTGSGGKIFSKDVLKIEKCGPDEDYLTVIDVPGIFRNINEGVTTTEDIELVRAMVKKYIKDSRTIILAVLAGNVHVDNQEILTLASQHDPTGERTLGVLTKPDLVLESSEKKRVCDLVLGKKKPLTLGYYVVRNRGADQSVDDQATNESIFDDAPWSELPRERVGAEALRKALCELLERLARREFPLMRKQVKADLDRTQEQIDDLGQSRKNEMEQRVYLSGIARKFQDIVKDALNGWYSDEKAFKRGSMRLITNIVNLSDLFHDDFSRYSHFYKFQDAGSTTAPSTPTDSSSDTEGDNMIRMCERTVENMTPIFNHEVYPELESLVFDGGEAIAPDDDAMEWLNKIYMESRNMDIGAFGSNIFSMAFKKQSTKWEEMTRSYMGKIIFVVHDFIAEALNMACPDARVERMIWSDIMDKLLARYKAALEQAILLVRIEREKRPYTLSKEFSEKLQVYQGSRTAALLESAGRGNRKHAFDESVAVTPNALKGAATGQSNVQRVNQEIHDKLRAYYDLAMCRFVDNVFQQAVDYSLLVGPETPLAVFDQDWVIKLEAPRLEEIAGESESSKSRRKILARKLKDLTAAMGILK
ncbi:hypothetical protein PG984_005720 [Apiospora sp. TS-2023a]